MIHAFPNTIWSSFDRFHINKTKNLEKQRGRWCCGFYAIVAIRKYSKISGLILSDEFLEYSRQNEETIRAYYIKSFPEFLFVRIWLSYSFRCFNSY